MHVEEELRAILEKRLSAGTAIEADTKLAEAGLDSLDIVEMSFDFEERFHVEHTTLQVDHAPEEFLRVERLIPDRGQTAR